MPPDRIIEKAAGHLDPAAFLVVLAAMDQLSSVFSQIAVASTDAGMPT